MATTPNIALRYPVLTDSPNVPRDIQNLATDVDTKMQFLPVSALPASGYDGQIVYNLTDGKAYVYKASASAWWTLRAYARYALTGTSTVTLSGGDQPLQFPTAIKTDPRVTPSGDFKTFTVTPGRWTITMGYRLADNVDNGAYLAVGTVSEANAFAAGPSVKAFANGLVTDIVEFSSTTVVAPFAWTVSATHAIAQGLDAYGVTHITFKSEI